MIRAGSPPLTVCHDSNCWYRRRAPRLVFAVVASAYSVIGSVHVEDHLNETHGDAYRRYQPQVPFFIPGTPAGPLPSPRFADRPSNPYAPR